jgi:hypothetical protein
MKHLKILGLAAVAAVALMAFAGTASATVLTSPAGTTYTGAVKVASEGEMTFDNELGQYGCEWTMEAKVESHGAAATAGGKIFNLGRTGCTGNISSFVLRPGSLEFHTAGESADGNGTLTLVGFEIQINYEALGVTCRYGTGAGVSLGTLTGSKNTGSKATVDGSSPKVPKTQGGLFCGEFATLTGNFGVVSPTYLDVD